MTTLKIATRKSKLALWQAEHVAAQLRAAHPGLQVELVPITTQGDRIVDRSLAAIGGKGLFIKELEVALEARGADIAVHSMKDVPSDLPHNMQIGAVLVRADVRDAFCATQFPSLDDLPKGARVGTSSLRRQAQLLAHRSDLRIEPLRGNVDTRLRRLDAGELDAIILASAGLTRLGWEARITAHLPVSFCLPSPGQGAIGIECRAGDLQTLRLIAPLDHEPTHQALDAERAFARGLGGSCQSPIAALAQISTGQPNAGATATVPAGADAPRSNAGAYLELAGLVADPDGSRLIRDSIGGAAGDAEALGATLAQRVLAAGAADLLERLRA